MTHTIASPVFRRTVLRSLLALGALQATAALVGCSTPMTGVDLRTNSVSYPDIAVPAGTSLDLKRSVIIGEGGNWTGRLLASTESSETEAANYILKQMQGKGWQLLSSVHADKSTYFFSNAQKIMLIEVAKKGALSIGSGADITYLSSFRTDSGALRGR